MASYGVVREEVGGAVVYRRLRPAVLGTHAAKRLLIGAWGAALVVTVAFGLVRSGPNMLVCCVVPFMLLATGLMSAVMWPPAGAPMLRLDEAGAVYDGLDFSAATTWDNVERLQEGALAKLVLCERRLTGGPGRNGEGWYIPLGPFRYARGSELEADLRRLAPHLFRRG